MRGVVGIGGVVVVGPGDRGVLFCDEDFTENPAQRKKVSSGTALIDALFIRGCRGRGAGCRG